MKSIIYELCSRVYDGEKFHVDFEKRNLKIGKEYLVKDGEYDKEKYYLLDNITMEKIENLYEQYKYSTPSERSESKYRRYFKALSVDELTDRQLAVGASREVAQAELEGSILCAILNGNLTWKDEWGTFFYQGADADFILLKKWISRA